MTASAVRQLAALPKLAQVRLRRKIDALEESPRPSGVKKLVDEENVYRIRVGDYRILYQIQDARPRTST